MIRRALFPLSSNLSSSPELPEVPACANTLAMASSSDATRSSFDGFDLNDIVIFARVVQHGSFTAAAKLFGKSPSYLPFYSVAREIRSGKLVSLFEGEIISRRVIKALYPKICTKETPCFSRDSGITAQGYGRSES